MVKRVGSRCGDERFLEFDMRKVRRLCKSAQVIQFCTTNIAALWGGKEAVKLLGYFQKAEGEDHKEEWDNLNQCISLLQGIDAESYLGLLHSVKSGAMKKSDKAKDEGTERHEILEQYILSLIRGQKLEAPEWANEFIAWHEENVKEFILSEARVADLTNEYAGTLDTLAVMKNGNVAVIDFKCSNNSDRSWKLQLAAYAKTFLPYGIEVKERYTIRVPVEGFTLKWDGKKRIHQKVANSFEVISYPDYLDFDFDTFLHFRAAAKWINVNK